MAVKETHSKHMTICAHAEGRLGIHYAVVAGVDSVEHGFYVSDEDIELMKNQGTFLSPTLIAGHQIAVYGKERCLISLIKKCANMLMHFIRM